MQRQSLFAIHYLTPQRQLGGAMSWLSAMDVTSAFASAVVVAIISLVMLKQMRARFGFIVGALCAVIVAVQSAIEYNPFASVSATVVLVVQFLALSFAMPLTIKAFEKCTLTNDSLRRI
jgi:hypothetical protein